MWSSSIVALIRGQLKTSRFVAKRLAYFWLKIVTQTVILGCIFWASIHFEWSITGVDGLVAGIAIFAGGFLAGFTHLAAVRQTLNAREATYGEAERPERDLVDVSVTRLLSATLVSAVTAALLVVGSNVAGGTNGCVTGYFAASAWVGAALTLMLFLATIPSLYSAYVQMNTVRRELDGSDFTKPQADHAGQHPQE